MIRPLVRDLDLLVGRLLGASTEQQVGILQDMSLRVTRVKNHLFEELKFERTLEVFNQHGTEADPPFGAMPINGQVLVCNYYTTVGVWVNGHIKDKEFITREVAARWGRKGDKGYV